MVKSSTYWLVVACLIPAGVLLLVPDSPLFLPNFFGTGGYYRGLPARYWLRRLTSPDVEARRQAARALGANGSAAGEAVPALGEAMLEDVDRGVRVEAALALTKMSPASRAALPALIQALDDRDPMVRMNATLAILVLGAPAQPAVPALLRALSDERNQTNCGVFAYSIQEMTAVALGRASAGTGAAVPSLVALLKAGERAETREAAARSLGEVGSAAAKTAPQLRALLQDTHEETRRAAAEALQKIGAGMVNP